MNEIKKGKKDQYIGVLDLGTTSVRFILFNLQGKAVTQSFCKIGQYYPKPGWVEEDPEEILSAIQKAISASIGKSEIDVLKIAAIGITNQRESTMVWNRKSGNPYSKLIVWQDRRTSKRCSELKALGCEDTVRKKTGLTIDPYFSATKLEYILQRDLSLRKKAEEGKAAFGTLDSWIIYKLTGRHLTDVSNASRTMLFNIDKLCWDRKLLEIFNIPHAVLPEVLPSFGNAIYGYTLKDSVFTREIPVCSVFGDQQAALFGQRCFKKGDIKSTFGTGSFLMMNIGSKKILSENNLLTTIFYKSAGGEVFYALEGSIYNTGSVFQWLKEEMGIIDSYSEIEKLGSGLNYQENLFIVPALTGLGAPFWDPYARGLIIGLSRSTGRKNIVRAAVESAAYRARDVIIAMEKDCKFKLGSMKIDGGVSGNKLFCQVLADITGLVIERFDLGEITALGAMYGAGIGIGVWDGPDRIKVKKASSKYYPKISSNLREKLYRKWSSAVEKAGKWMIGK